MATGLFLITAFFAVILSAIMAGTSPLLGGLAAAWMTFGGVALLIVCGLTAAGLLPHNGPADQELFRFAIGAGLSVGGGLVLHAIQEQEVQ